MDKNLRSFISLSLLLMLSLLSAIAVFGLIYSFSTLNTYNLILLIMTQMIILITLIFCVSVLASYHAYKKGAISPLLFWPVKVSLNVLLPFIIFLSGLLKGKKNDRGKRDLLRGFYINLNNIFVQSGAGRYRYRPEEILLLLPHCLQDSNCGYKITGDIRNCRRCGRCCIGEIAKLSERTGVNAVVATGGTVARNAVVKSKPRIILSIACERDLTSGIEDVKGIPVIGIVNRRPNGPCSNTLVDVNVLKEKLGGILKECSYIGSDKDFA